MNTMSKTFVAVLIAAIMIATSMAQLSPPPALSRPADGSMPPMDGSRQPVRRCPCPVNGTRPPMNNGTFNGTRPHMNGTMNGSHPNFPPMNGTFNGTFPRMNGTFNGTFPKNGTHHFNGSFPDMNRTLNGSFPPMPHDKNGSHHFNESLPPMDDMDCPCPDDFDGSFPPMDGNRPNGDNKKNATRAPMRTPPRLRVRLTGNSWRNVLNNNRTSLEAKVRIDIARSLNVSATRVRIVDMQIGSLVVDFEVDAQEDGTYEDTLTETAIQNTIEKADFSEAVAVYASSGANDTVTVSGVVAVNTTSIGSAAASVNAMAAVAAAVVCALAVLVF